MFTKMINKKLNNKNGFSLPVVIMVFAVLSILLTSVIFLSQNNTKQIDAQEDNLRAYYVARAGVDLAYAAMMQPDSDINYQYKVDRLIDNDGTITHNDLGIPQSNPIGTVDVEVSLVDDEVKIQAISQMNDDNETYRLSFYFKQNNFSKTRWVRND